MGHECAPRAVVVSLSFLSILIFALVASVTFSFPLTAGAKQFPKAMGTEKCLTCHEGIERIGDNPVKSKLTCTNCHKGNPEATGILSAHKGMHANPSDFRVVKQTCGICHRKETENMMHSLHATSAGVISGTRYAWGAQGKQAKYANYDVERAGSQGPGTVKSLKQLPFYDPSKPEGPENNPADDYLRNQCLRCHLWSKGHERAGDYRASGCAACHMVYSDSGKYEGGDKAINKDKPGRPRFHRITKKIPANQCIHCHNRGARTGPSFIGTMESAGYGTPWTPTGGKQGRLHGQNYDHLEADVHYQRGMTCIDCHTLNDIHGDGNIYEKRHYAIEIECEDCHGSIDKRSNLMTSRGRPLTNLKRKGKEIILLAKLTGKEHTVPQLADMKKVLSPEGHAAMVAIPTHMEKLECYACHARWAPQCYGCHAKQDIGKPSGDWINTKNMDDASQSGMRANRQKTAYDWQESRSYLRWETPVLGINTEGKVSPFIPGCQVIFTQMKGKKNIVNNKIFKTVDGTLGIGHSPVQPHTVSAKSRTCADCHMSRKAIGLGTGIYNAKDNGLPIDTELERIVDEDGKQIQQVAHKGARPFTKAEQQRITRVGTCLACHVKDTGIWKMEGKAPTDRLHNQAIRAMTK
ncbi:MAG: hypothetical protein ACE5K1_10210 [Acidiferrobacterales bacterium]